MCDEKHELSIQQNHDWIWYQNGWSISWEIRQTLIKQVFEGEQCNKTTAYGCKNTFIIYRSGEVSSQEVWYLLKPLSQINNRPYLPLPYSFCPVPVRGAWPKTTIRLSHHMSLVPDSTALTRWFYHPFQLAKIPYNHLKKTCENTPFFSISLCRYSFSKPPITK